MTKQGHFSYLVVLTNNPVTVECRRSWGISDHKFCLTTLFPKLNNCRLTTMPPIVLARCYSQWCFMGIHRKLPFYEQLQSVLLCF